MSNIVCCLTFLNERLAFWVSNSDFLKVFKPLKPEKILCSIETVLFSESELVSASLAPFWFVRLVDVEELWFPDTVMLGKNSLLEIFLLCLADSKFFL